MTGIFPELQDRVERFIGQETPNHLFYHTSGSDVFADPLRAAFKDVWLERLQEGEALATKGVVASGDTERINDILDRLRKDIKYQACETRLTMFNNEELEPRSMTNLRHRSIDLITMFREPNRDLVEALLTLDMLKRASASHINVVAPWLPYQRGDKKSKGGKVPIAAKWIFDVLYASAGHRLERIITIDLHAAQAEAFSDGPVDHLSAVPYFARYLISNYFQEKYNSTLSDITVVSPDAGGADRAEKLATLLSVPYVVYDKRRPKPGDADIHSAQQVKTKYAVIIDDMIDTGGTLAASVEVLKERDGVEEVFAFATHGLFSPKHDDKDTTRILYHAEDKLRKSGAKVIITDTIPRSAEFYGKNKDWLVDVVSMARPISYAILLNRLGHSISESMAEMKEKIRFHAELRKQMKIDKYLLKIDKIA